MLFPVHPEHVYLIVTVQLQEKKNGHMNLIKSSIGNEFHLDLRNLHNNSANCINSENLILRGILLDNKEHLLVLGSTWFWHFPKVL